MNMQSEEINELAEALSKAQGLIEGAAKDSKNPFFKSSYADLHSVIACAKEPLSSNGLSVVQPTQIIDGQLCLVTMLIHKSGQWLKSIMPLVLAKQDPQSVGSAITYYRRYNYCSLVGISSIDDDGNAAMDRKDVGEKVQPKAPSAPTINDLVLAMAKGGDLIKQATVAEYVKWLSEQRKLTTESIIKSALASEDNLQRFKKALMKDIDPSTPDSEAA